MFWRRILGGWLGLRRSLIMPSCIFCLYPAFFINWQHALIAWIVTMVYFSYGHIWSEGLGRLLLRYTLPAFIIAIISQFYLVGLAGLIIAITYAVCGKNPEDCKKLGNGFIDGKMAYAELIAGLVWFGSINLSFLML